MPVVFLGLSFLACALLIVGLPPLSGFVAKFSLLSAALFSSGATSNGWVLTATVLLSGFAGIMAFSRMGIHLFWTVQSPALPTVRLTEALPVAALIAICAALTIWAGPINAYLEATPHYLGEPNLYIEAVLSQHPEGPAWGTDYEKHQRTTKFPEPAHPVVFALDAPAT